MAELIELIKRAAVDAVSDGKPTGILFGNVTSTLPLRIKIDQRMTLDETALILTGNVKDQKLEATVNSITESAGNPLHRHEISGKKSFTVHNGLKVG
ncbi:MAG: DUF2577 domain-containing protein, partial [Oscillospiraceae bacterium]